MLSGFVSHQASHFLWWTSSSSLGTDFLSSIVHRLGKTVLFLPISPLFVCSPVLRSEGEHFWNQHPWSVFKIPEPDVRDRTTYGVLAAIIHVLDGIPRDAPRIMTDQLMAKLELRQKVYESVPKWAESAPPVDSSLLILDPQGDIPTKTHDAMLMVERAKKSIWTFTLSVPFA
jgi:hypothetical protein